MIVIFVNTAMLNASLKALSFIVSSRMAATCLLHPAEIIKIRMQLSDEKISAEQVISKIDDNEGILGIYAGLSANLLREAAFTTTRLAIFSMMSNLPSSDFFRDYAIGPFFVRYTLAGCVSSFIWTPLDVVFVRMAADGSLPIAERRNYSNVLNALLRILKEEGIFTLWRGVIPTVSLNLGSLIWVLPLLYSKGDRTLVQDFITFLWSAFFFVSVSGLSSAAALSPVDLAKTKIQTMKTIKGIPEHSDVVDVWKNTTSKEGFFALWKSFHPHYALLVFRPCALFVIRYAYINQDLITLKEMPWSYWFF